MWPAAARTRTRCRKALPASIETLAVSGLVGLGLAGGEGEADEAGGGFGGAAEDFEAAVVGFGDFAGDDEAEAEADIAGGIEGFGGAAGGFRSEAAAVIAKLEVDPVGAVAVGFALHIDGDAGGGGVGLEGIEHDFGDGVAEGGFVAFDDDRLFADAVFELGGFNGLELLGFLVGLLDEGGEGEAVAGGELVAGEEAHLVDEPGDTAHTIGEGGVEGGAELGVLVFAVEELLVCGERDHGITDLMGEAVGHLADEAEVGGFDLEVVELFGLGVVFDDEEGGAGQSVGLGLDGDDGDLVDLFGGIGGAIFVGGDTGAGFENLVDLAAEGGGEVAEVELAVAASGAGEVLAGGFVGVEDGEIAGDDDAAAAELAEDLGHHLGVGGELLVEPDIAEGEAEGFEEVEDEFQFGVGERFAGEAAVEDGDADEGFAVGDGDGDLDAEEFELLLHGGVGEDFAGVASEDAAMAEEVAADAGFGAELEVFEEALGESDCAGGVEETFCGAGAWIDEGAAGGAEEDGGAIDAEDFAELQEELFEESFGAERVAEDGGEIAEGVQAGAGGGRGVGLGWFRGCERVGGGFGGWGEGGIGGWGGRGGEPFEQGVQEPGFDGFAEDMADAVEVGILLPLPVTGACDDDDGARGGAAPDLLDHPDSLDVGVFHVDDAGVEQGGIEEGFGFLGIEAVDDAATFGIDSSTHRIHHLGVRGQYEERFHHSVERTRRQHITV